MVIHQPHVFHFHLTIRCFLLLILLILFGCAKDDMPNDEIAGELTDAEKYLLDVCLGSEFGGASNVVRKWTKDISIYLKHPGQLALVAEFEQIVQEINDLSSTIRLQRVLDEPAADFVIFFSDGATYVTHEPSAADFVDSNRGLVWIYWNNRSEIIRGSMYVDVVQVAELDCQKHLLREELTQGLGLLNDSFQYPTSIFQQSWTCHTAYDEIDRSLLSLFLSPEIMPGMTREALTELLQSN